MGIPRSRISGTGAQALAVWDDGAGEALYVAGSFTTTGSVLRNLLRWDGANWSAPWGSALFHGVVTTLAAVQTGPLAGLYAGGDMYQFNGTALGRLAKWDGATWSRLGEGTFFARPTTLAVFDPGDGDSLFVRGPFSNVAGVPVDELARWDGAAWHDVDRSLPREPFRVFDDGAGEALWFFPNSSAPTRWDGQSATMVGDAAIGVSSLARFNATDGKGNRTHAGLNAGTLFNRGVGRFGALSGDAWERLDTGPWTNMAFVGSVDLGDGAQSLVGAALPSSASSPPPADLLRLTNGQWRPMGTLPEAKRGVYSVARFDRGLAPGVAGVYFGLGPREDGFSSSEASGQFDGVAMWDGAAWRSLGGGLQHVETYGGNTHVFTGTGRHLLVHDDDTGGGSQLYVCGLFNRIEGQPTSNRLARWNGSMWSEVGVGPGGSTLSITLYDDGAGLKLYAAGSFHDPNGSPYGPGYPIARWDGHVWSYMYPTVYQWPGTGLGLGAYLQGGSSVLALSLQTPRFIGRWDGAQWGQLSDTSVSAWASWNVRFHALRRGAGEDQLIMMSPDRGVELGPRTDGILRSFQAWDGVRWSPPDTDAAGAIRSAVVYDDGSGPALWVAGTFGALGSKRTFNVGRLRVCDTSCLADLDFDGLVGMSDLNALLSEYSLTAGAGSSAPPFTGDLNFDRKVDFLDLNILLGRFGTACD